MSDRQSAKQKDCKMQGLVVKKASITPDETMKIRLVALVGLALSFSLPAFAQQTETPDPQLREALMAFNKKVDDGLNNNDAAALAALFTEDAVFVTDRGPVFGRRAIEKWYVDLFSANSL